MTIRKLLLSAGAALSLFSVVAYGDFINGSNQDVPAAEADTNALLVIESHTNAPIATSGHGPELDPVWAAVSNTVTTGAAAGATALQAESDPVWSASSNDYATVISVTDATQRVGVLEAQTNTWNSALQAESDPIWVAASNLYPRTIALNGTTNTVADGAVDLGTITGADNLGNGDGGGTVTISNVVAVADAGGTNSVDPNARVLLLGDGTTPQIDYSDTLNPSAPISISGGFPVFNAAIKDLSDAMSVDTVYRQLYDNSTAVMDWAADGVDFSPGSASKATIGDNTNLRAGYFEDGNHVIAVGRTSSALRAEYGAYESGTIVAEMVNNGNYAGSFYYDDMGGSGAIYEAYLGSKTYLAAGYFTDGNRTATLGNGSYAGQFFDGITTTTLNDATRALRAEYGVSMGGDPSADLAYNDGVNTHAGYFLYGAGTKSAWLASSEGYAGKFYDNTHTVTIGDGTNGIRVTAPDFEVNILQASAPYAAFFADTGLGYSVKIADGVAGMVVTNPNYTARFADSTGGAGAFSDGTRTVYIADQASGVNATEGSYSAVLLNSSGGNSAGYFTDGVTTTTIGDGTNAAAFSGGQVVLASLATNQVTPVTGAVYYNTATSNFLGYAEGRWKPLTSSMCEVHLTGTQAFTSGAGFEILTNFAANVVDYGFTVTDSNIVVSTAGRYLVTVDMSFETATASQVDVLLYTNGVSAAAGFSRTQGASTADGVTAFSKTLTLAASDLLDIRVDYDADETMTVTHCTWRVEQK